VVIFAAVVLFLNALFTVLTWPRFLKRVALDPRATAEDGSRTRFYTVHRILVTVALILAAASVIAGIVLLADLG
jgi:ABC-type Mn2+/Zn2+ transport system permease subunit